jgi:5,6,7,8-tetrahydromethanopterin hydro-lyase
VYLVGEGFTGSGSEAAHVNSVLGDRDGPVGTAFATALGSPSDGHAPFLVVAQPGLAVQPPTLFVNKARIQGEAHARMTWGPAQAGVAGGVIDALAEGVLSEPDLVGVVLICAVWVDPAAGDDQAVFANNRQATVDALRAGAVGFPPATAVLAARDAVWNPFFRPDP